LVESTHDHPSLRQLSGVQEYAQAAARQPNASISAASAGCDSPGARNECGTLHQIDLDESRSSVTVDLPAAHTSPLYDGYLLDLTVFGELALNQGGDGDCLLHRRVRLRDR